VAAPSWAGGIGAGIGYWDTADAEDDTAISLKLVFDFGPKWNFDMRAAFYDGFEQTTATRELSFEAVPIDMGISYDFQTDSRLTPYVGGGLNYTLYQSESFNTVLGQPEASRVKDEAGWYAVAGIDLPFNKRMAFYAEVMYRQNKAAVQGDGLASFDEIRVDFSGPSATVGLVYTW
jgi:outer membrane protein W